MVNPRIILNKYKWKKDCNLEEIKVYYIHRGAPNDTKIITGEEIIEIGRSFMKTKNAMIPYHRIFKIKYQNQTIFIRKKRLI